MTMTQGIKGYTTRLQICLFTFCVTTGVGYGATTTFKLLHGDAEYCRAFLKSFQTSPLSYLSDRKTCDVLVRPVTELLHSPELKEVSWKPYPVKDVVSTAIRLYDINFENLAYKMKKVWTKAEYDRGKVQRKAWIDGITKMNNSGYLYTQKAKVKIDHSSYYVLEVATNHCGLEFNIMGLPKYAFFKDRNFKHPAVTNQLFAGKLVYYKGRLSVFDYYAGGWIADAPKKYRIMYLISGYWDPRKGAYDIYDAYYNRQCDINITRYSKPK